MSEVEYTIVVYTDGSCMPNPGKGGWAFVALDKDGEEVEIFGGEKKTTNNIMEMAAVMEALRYFWFEKNFRIFSDSQYVINCAQGKWKRKKNQELWKEFDTLANGKNIEWVWIRGHSGNPYNERVDRLAKEGVNFM